MFSKLGLMVLLAVYFQPLAISGSSVNTQSFYVKYLLDRGISSFLVGLFGMMPGIGYLFNMLFDTQHFLLTEKGVALWKYQLTFVAVNVLQMMGQGLVGLISQHFNFLAITILLFLRAVQGYVGFLACKGVVEGCRVWFPDHVKLTIGLTNSGYHSGGAASIVIGGVLYDNYGFTSALLIAGGICSVLFVYKLAVLPRNNQAAYVNSDTESDDEKVEGIASEREEEGNDCKECSTKDATIIENKNVTSPQPALIKEDTETAESGAEEEINGRKTGLSLLLLIPIVSYSILEALVGFTSAITTPYLNDEFNVSISQGGTYLFVLYFGRFTGAVTSGSIIQKGWATASQIMAFSAFLAGFGVFILFPNQKLTFLYENVEILAYVSALFQGFANQMSTLAALFAFEDVQVKLAKREMNDLTKSRSTTIWLCLWTAFNRIGHLVALLAMEHLTYEQGGWMMIGFCVISLCTSVGMEIALKNSSRILQ